jgi:cytochrome b6-f complex iron-sulfur subunit
MASVLGFLGVNFVMFLRFFLTRALYEPKTNCTIGYPSDFGFGVDTKFQNQYRIWVVRNTEGIFVISAICTHLGCTPDWKASENKFSVPATAAATIRKVSTSKDWRAPMDRAHVELDPEGQDRSGFEPSLPVAERRAVAV